MITPRNLMTLGRYGIVLVENDETGERASIVTDDAEYARAVFIDAPRQLVAGLELPMEKFPVWRPGWPDEWAESTTPGLLEEEIDAAFAFEAGPWHVSQQAGFAGLGGSDV